ncbi:hypothetical protein [Stackebrandtia nassauensis]|uniref:Uncharacterized protein n=1 Tax=Stackebrandtia nassauensis (strain DSM 44728 / CIP 108903 / NRRL B-16338 / NBRC 102104 / LLR-40K-21) TaxID=446470 RepID=D3PW04_STANL|nr:hypothetical protein [Stackebrandtia nassauensis]ADD45125.1 hypothetical protein Snas_5494 [Stackebrandtia nassauensis DSM 44728]
MTETRSATPTLNRWRRLSRRVLLPLAVLVLLAALAVTGYARFAGSPASAERPFHWDGSTAYVAGGHTPGTYTTCEITPNNGKPRILKVPGSSGGVSLEPWFKGTAEITCGRSVLVTTGMPSSLYPVVSQQAFLVGIAALAVLAWWCGRMPRARLSADDPFCRKSVE